MAAGEDDLLVGEALVSPLDQQVLGVRRRTALRVVVQLVTCDPAELGRLGELVGARGAAVVELAVHDFDVAARFVELPQLLGHLGASDLVHGDPDHRAAVSRAVARRVSVAYRLAADGIVHGVEDVEDDVRAGPGEEVRLRLPGLPA
ncbi:hypothetical protein [Streptomyces sp. A1547]|uniref:hypothetical protein n=1 Tax=Streptomyces sp. A1547 TaxID=2563105 RepID=UPI00144A5459|nr:hypothetical protein [Streptomyces sp. A1547]